MKNASFYKIITSTFDYLFALLVIGLVCFILTSLAILISGETDKDPYSEGTHLQYQIRCENGFVYKVRHKEGAIQVLNSDGTPLRCGKKIY